MADNVPFMVKTITGGTVDLNLATTISKHLTRKYHLRKPRITHHIYYVAHYHVEDPRRPDRIGYFTSIAIDSSENTKVESLYGKARIFG